VKQHSTKRTNGLFGSVEKKYTFQPNKTWCKQPHHHLERWDFTAIMQEVYRN